MKVKELVTKEIKFDKGQLYVVGGRCGMGKTSFVKNKQPRDYITGFF